MAELPVNFVAGFFKDPHAFVAAGRAARDAGFQNLDGVMPYPVHGFDADLGLKRSWIGRPVLFMLLTGAFLGFMMQQWMMEGDWPIIFAGKPYNSWPAFVVITFEMGILLGALTNFAMCLFVACKIRPRPVTRILRQDLTDDTFALAIPIQDGNPASAELAAFLADQGAEDVTEFRRDGQQNPGHTEGGDHE